MFNMYRIFVGGESTNTQLWSHPFFFSASFKVCFGSSSWEYCVRFKISELIQVSPLENSLDLFISTVETKVGLTFRLKLCQMKSSGWIDQAWCRQEKCSHRDLSPAKDLGCRPQGQVSVQLRLAWPNYFTCDVCWEALGRNFGQAVGYINKLFLFDVQQDSQYINIMAKI